MAADALTSGEPVYAKLGSSWKWWHCSVIKVSSDGRFVKVSTPQDTEKWVPREHVRRKVADV